MRLHVGGRGHTMILFEHLVEMVQGGKACVLRNLGDGHAAALQQAAGMGQPYLENVSGQAEANLLAKFPGKMSCGHTDHLRQAGERQILGKMVVNMLFDLVDEVYIVEFQRFLLADAAVEAVEQVQKQHLIPVRKEVHTVPVPADPFQVSSDLLPGLAVQGQHAVVKAAEKILGKYPAQLLHKGLGGDDQQLGLLARGSTEGAVGHPGADQRNGGGGEQIAFTVFKLDPAAAFQHIEELVVAVVGKGRICIGLIGSVFAEKIKFRIPAF